MELREAELVIAAFVAAFPRDLMPDSTVLTWAKGLTAVTPEDAMVAVDDCVHLYDRMPSLHQILVACDRAKADRLLDTPQLEESNVDAVSFGDWLDANPEYRKLIDAIGKGPA